MINLLVINHKLYLTLTKLTLFTSDYQVPDKAQPDCIEFNVVIVTSDAFANMQITTNHFINEVEGD